MEKIKFILVTLLCMVGVMNVSAGVVTESPHPQAIFIADDCGVLNGRNWTSVDTYGTATGGKLTISTTAEVSDNGNGYLVLKTSNNILQANNTLTITAPTDWHITRIVFNVDDCTNIRSVSCLGQSKNSGTIDVPVDGSQTAQIVSTSTRAYQASSVTLTNFYVYLAKNSINDNLANTVQGHWFWVQDTPTAGNIYKIVNATSNKTDIIAIGPRPNNTVASGDDGSESSVLVNDMVRAGEWLITNSGNGVTITSVDDDKTVGVYESHINIPGREEKFGAEWNQVWTIDNLTTINGVDGHYIHCPFDVDFWMILHIQGHTECYLRLSDGFKWIQDNTGIKAGNMGWSGLDGTGVLSGFTRDINSVQHLWNFYSIEQYDCYVDFMTAYNAFDELYAEYYNNTDYPEYKEVYDIVNEAGKRWQGETDETREETYEIIDRMLNVIATIKGGSDSDIKPIGTDFPINNPGAEHEASFDGWRTRRIATDNTNTSKAVKVDNNAHSEAAAFELKNATMSQMVSGIKSGVYMLSVYWKSDNTDAKIALQAKSSAETVDNTFKVADITEAADANGYRKTEVEVVVVDGNVTVGASINTGTGASVYLDDFKLEYVCKNYWEFNEAKDTRVYRGVFLGSEAGAPEGDIKKDHPNNEAKAIVTDDVPYADITQAYFVSFEFDNSANPNGLCYTKTETTKTIKTKTTTTEPATEEINVIRGNECAKLILVDGHPYSAKADFTATSAHYEMKAVGKDDGEGYQYGSLMLPYEAVIPSGTEAYTVAISGEGLELTEITNDKIPANTPVLVTKTGDFDGEGIVDKADAGNYTVSSLVGVYTLGVKAPVGSYVLQKQNGHLAYYQVKENKRDKLTINPFRSYLWDSKGGAKAASFDIVPGETDGISEIVNGLNHGEIYDLSGRRVEKMVRGLYIVNGKKVLVK